MKKFLPVCFSLVFALSTVYAQERVVTGKVTSSEDGSTLPGVNVVLKGTNNGTVTDANGNFSITVSPGGSLIFSFIGLQTQEILIGERTAIDVSLQSDVTQLNEVIVTTAGGLQARSRELGSANTIITPQTLTAGRAVNVAAGLQGKVAGFQINATSSGVNPEYRLILRGQRSMTGNNQALIVIDNVIVPSAVLSNMNQNDIESVNILQGAGAAALYGSQASNGAVIITTKKGSKNGTIDITVSQTVQVQEVAFYPKIQEKFGSGGSAYGIQPDGRPFFNYLENQSYGPAFDGSIRPLGPKLEDGSQLYTPYTFKPGHDDFWDKGITSQTDFSLSTGTDKSSFFVSGQYVTVTGTTPGDKYTRGNIRVNGMQKFGDKVQVTYTTSYAPNKYDISSATGTIYQNMLNMPSNVDITQYKDWRTDKFANPNGYYNPWYLNPYFSAETNRSLTKNDYLTGSLELKFTPIEGLDLIARQGVATRAYSDKSTTEGFTYSTYSKNTDQSSKSNIPSSVTETSMNTAQLVTDFIAQYNKNFGSINLNVVGGTQLIDNTSRTLAVNANGLIVQGLYNLNNGTGTPLFGEADYHTRLMGVYGKVTLGYKDYLFVTGTGRNDWDSRLNEANRSFFYPSADVSFVLTDAVPAIKDIKFINYIKLRGGVSKTGLVNLGTSRAIYPGGAAYPDLGAYNTLPTFSPNISYGLGNGFPYGSLAGYSLDNTLVSKSIKPEITHGVEFGVDFTLWDERISGSVSYFSTVTDNQTITTSVSNSTGFSSLLTNIGETSAHGTELTLHVTPIKTANWTVTVGGNYTYLENKVNSISDLLPLVSLYTSSTNIAISAAVAGQSFPVIMGQDYQRDPQGRVIVDATTGVPTATSGNVILGNATPKHRLSTDAQVSWKNLHFSILFEYRGGYSIFNGVGTEMDWAGTSYRSTVYDRQSFVFPNSVTQATDGSFIPNKTVTIANGNGNSGFWSDGINRSTASNYVTSGDFVKLREVALSYDLPRSFVGKSKIFKGATISVQGRNLFLWMAKDNYYTDPEYSSSGSNNSGNGMGLNDLGQTPPVRYYGGTLSLKL